MNYDELQAIAALTSASQTIRTQKYSANKTTTTNTPEAPITPKLHKTLRKNLNILKNALRDDWDCCIVIDGRVGSGKSVLGLQIATYFDPNFTTEQIVYSAEQFQEVIKTAEPYSAVMFDEAIRGLYARSSMAEENKNIVKILNECRQKNLALILILPSVFDLDRSIVLHRANCLIHVYSIAGKVGEVVAGEQEYTRKRGYFRFYGPAKLTNLYINGKKMYNYRAGRAGFSGKFIHYYPISETTYRLHKKKHFLEANFSEDQQAKNENEGYSLSTADIEHLINR